MMCRLWISIVGFCYYDPQTVDADRLTDHIPSSLLGRGREKGGGLVSSPNPLLWII